MNFSIEILLEEMIPVVEEQNEIECQQKSIKQKIFSLFRLSRFWCKKPNFWNLNRIFLSKCKVADCGLHEGNQTCNYGETTFRSSRSTILINNFLEILDWQEFNPRININDLSVKSSFTWARFSLEILIDELKPRVAEKLQFEQWDVSKMMAFF